MTAPKYLAITLCLFCIAGQADAERQRISLAPQEGIYTKADIEEEIIFGREMAATILAKHKLHTNENFARYLNLIGQSILLNADRSEIDFYFAAIESSEINAYATPGGYIFVTTAALGLMENEAELATVLAHEVAHVSDRHIVKALKIRADDESMTAVVGKIVGSAASSANVIFDQAVAYAVDLLFSKGLNREDEEAADKQGLILAALAGYDPAAYYQFLERIEPLVESDQGEMSKTHPPFSQRISVIRNFITSEGLSHPGGKRNQDRFVHYSLTGD